MNTQTRNARKLFMKEEIAKKIQETNQKYLGKLVNQEIPQKLEKQLKDMDWSYLDLIHRKKHLLL